LNRMLWTCESFDEGSFRPIPPAQTLSCEAKEVEGKTWGQCLELWRKAKWTEREPFPYSCHAVRWSSRAFQVLRVRTRFRLTSVMNTESKMRRAYDLYIRVRAFSPDGSKAIFEDPDHDVAQDELVRVKREDRPDLHRSLDVTLGNRSDVTLGRPKIRDCWYGWSCKLPENIFTVFKYDVPGGFEKVPPRDE